MLDLEPVVIEDRAEEPLDVARVDPRRAEAGVDLARRQVGRDDLAECGHVPVETGVVPGGVAGGAQLVADVA
jgi:hypothetical protein